MVISRGDARGRRLIVVNFACETYRPAQRSQSASARAMGADRVIAWDLTRLRANPFYAANADILAEPRGCGWWLWKPFIIHEALAGADDGDVVVYWDVGPPRRPNRFDVSPWPLVDWCAAHANGMLPGSYVPQHGPNLRWTRRDCFIGMGCDSERYWNHPQIQSTFSVWIKSAASLAFVAEWLACCTRRELISDDPNRLGQSNFDTFVDHRHDQSILTNLVIRHGLRCYGDAECSKTGTKNINNLFLAAGGRPFCTSGRLRAMERWWLDLKPEFARATPRRSVGKPARLGPSQTSVLGPVRPADLAGL